MSPFHMPPRAPRMRPFNGPSVWLEFSPLSNLTNSINLGQGFPGWGPPPFLTQALQQSAQNDAYSQYARSAGEPKLIKQISRTYSDKLVPKSLQASRAIDPFREVLVTVGASQAVQVACQALLGDGDEVLLIEPAFDVYRGAVLMAGGTPVYVQLRSRCLGARLQSSADLVLDMDEFASKLSSNTRMLVLNSPHNPTGKVFTRGEYEQIAKIIDERAPQCVVLSDEVYEHLVFEGEHVPFASVSASAFERTLSIYSAGKTFSTTGLKIGWVVGNANLMKDLQIAQQFIVFSVSTCSQIAIADALRIAEEPYEGERNYYEWLCGRYRRKRDLMMESLRGAGMSAMLPQGAFYVCCDVSKEHPARRVAGLPDAIRAYVDDGDLQIDPGTVGRVDYNIARNMALGGVTSIPVSAFYSPEHVGETELSDSFVRFAFCKPEEILKKAASTLLKYGSVDQGTVNSQ